MSAEPSFHVAGLGARSYAFLIDWHVRAMLAAGWSVGTFAVLAGLQAGGIHVELGDAAYWVLFGPAAALYLLYHPVCEIARKGSTPGKRIAGIRIVDRSGGNADASQHVVRNLMRLVDSLPVFYLVGIAVALLHPEQLRLGDMTASTILIYDAPGPTRQHP